MTFLFFLTTFAIISYSFYIFKKVKTQIIINEFKLNYRNIILTGIFNLTAYSLILIAFTLENIGYVIALRQINIILIMLVGFMIFKENFTYSKIIATSIIFIGTILIALA